MPSRRSSDTLLACVYECERDGAPEIKGGGGTLLVVASDHNLNVTVSRYSGRSTYREAEHTPWNEETEEGRPCRAPDDERHQGVT